MIYLREITLPDDPDRGWPYTVPALRGKGTVRFEQPVTLLCGENGSGKSTFLECLAVRLAAPAVGRIDAARDETLADLRPYAKRVRTVFAAKPRATLFLRSEDFFNFILAMGRERTDMRRELERVERENAGRGAFAQNQAKMAYAGSIRAMESQYGEDLLGHASHGEGFLRLFQERIVPNGLYLLDEPEAPLSPLRQMALLSLVLMMAGESGCQFLIATHSPILLASPGAAVFTFDAAPFAETAYAELESVRLLKSFLADPERYLRGL